MRNITSVKYTWPERIEDADIKDVVAQLLTAAPSKRLGCRAGNAKDVKKHAFFAKVRALLVWPAVVFSTFVWDHVHDIGRLFAHRWTGPLCFKRASRLPGSRRSKVRRCAETESSQFSHFRLCTRAGSTDTGNFDSDEGRLSDPAPKYNGKGNWDKDF
jgi:hypothetical protein